MSFDSKKFLSSGLHPREIDVPVPDLKDYFQEDAKPVFRVRGLTGHELGAAQEAVEQYRNVRAIVEGLTGPRTDEARDAIERLVGKGGKTPQEIVKRLEYLKIGCLDPIVDQDLASRICTYFPITFYALTNEIVRLTGLGHQPGKPQSSGMTKE